MPALFAATLFMSATLLFMVQPMVGKMILPLLGGSPAAWNTCMVFFQALLLLGYLYAHTLTGRTPGRTQLRLHLAVLGLAAVWLVGAAAVSPAHSPVGVFRSLAPSGQGYPVFGVLVLLAAAIGLPFWVVSTSAPLLQRWFADTGHPAARDPYFLYAASNAGSLISLLGYPILVEPSLTLVEQAWVWTAGFVVLIGLITLCGRAAANPPPAVMSRRDRGRVVPPPPAPTGPPPGWPRKLRWLGLAFVPSSLMLGVTFHLTTDIASVPLLWVIPLALYLVTFIIAYARTPDWVRPTLMNASPVLTLLLVFVLTSQVMAGQPFYALVVHLVVYFFAALLLHSELARLRPDPAHLTEYFLWISVGGVLGGLFNAFVAPALFPSDYEYPLTIAAGCLLLPPFADGAGAGGWRRTLLDLAAPVGLFAAAWFLAGAATTGEWLPAAAEWAADAASRAATFCGLNLALSGRTVRLFVAYAVPCMLCFVFIERPVRFGLCVAAVFLAHYVRAGRSEEVEWSARSPFGILRVYDEQRVFRAFAYEPNPDAPAPPGEAKGTLEHYVAANYYKLLHGTTLHGQQAAASYTYPLRDDAQLLGAAGPWQGLAVAGMLASWDGRQEPLTYYHRTGPVGWAVRRARQIDPAGHTGMVGLGTGSVAAYAEPGQRLTFYEIDRTVVDLVDGGKYFTYVNAAKARGAAVNIVLGDARLKLETSTDRYNLLLIDAFSSDSIPVHLLTREAIELYKDRLADHGLLALHISNRYIELAPVVARLAKDAHLAARIFRDNDKSYPGKAESSWVVLAKSEADLGDLLTGPAADSRVGAVAGGLAFHMHDHPWKPLALDPLVDAWTDDYSDVLRVMNIPQIRSARRFFGLPVPALRAE